MYTQANGADSGHNTVELLSSFPLFVCPGGPRPLSLGLSLLLCVDILQTMADGSTYHWDAARGLGTPPVGPDCISYRSGRTVGE